MNLYHCMIELKQDAKALAFSAAAEAWLSRLQSRGIIVGWRLLRRKFGLASGPHTDFLLEIEVEGLSQLDSAFRALASGEDDDERRYNQFHQMIGRAEVGLYRPYPDPSQRERIAFI
ncbi:DUF6614 family protein [Rubellimicrobium aerolatum]|uniref:DUF6614 family protein n=1 Tax=Rubellimicrobium aerolatum TaxID=490979 RepID=A0ABW0S8D2_9RHOB|nr:DUF6614 family protein [Rubellimicrobium aerolatum]MBP1804269.1 hypothetical protein [Rubellimicrobium aerolatum]